MFVIQHGGRKLDREADGLGLLAPSSCKVTQVGAVHEATTFSIASYHVSKQ